MKRQLGTIIHKYKENVGIDRNRTTVISESTMYGYAHLFNRRGWDDLLVSLIPLIERHGRFLTDMRIPFVYNGSCFKVFSKICSSWCSLHDCHCGNVKTVYGAFIVFADRFQLFDEFLCVIDDIWFDFEIISWSGFIKCRNVNSARSYTRKPSVG